MAIERLLNNLNENQRAAATFSGTHALVLAGAGTGKTRTIIARAGYLIHSGVPADRIQVLTFTRRSAKEIVERVKVVGDQANGLNASTLHTWCMTLIRRMPKLFGCVGHTVIDREDQIQLFRRLRGGEKKSNSLPPAKTLCDIYSYARNTRSSLSKTLELHYQEELQAKEKIADVIRGYEAKKRERHYLDYDDILDVVATVIKQDVAIRNYICQQYDHLLVDEMQDTNPLQWELLEPLCSRVNLFCVGDDAQSIYGFRGADFRNVHSFTERVPNSEVLRLEQNYRSTQEILDLSNWLLAQSPISYNKLLVAVRGQGHKPKLLDFESEWDESRWIADDIARRREEGADWARHMILTRSGFAARAMETTLLARNIPYVFIGGTKLLESAHIRDVLSLLRVVANPLDELAWMRYLTLWPRVGDVTANDVIEQFPATADVSGFLDVLNISEKLPTECKAAFNKVVGLSVNPGEAYLAAKQALWPTLQHTYEKDWDRRRSDFDLVERLVRQHTTILAFIEEYLLNPVSTSDVLRKENDDVVCLITIHSAKGTECPVCYILNVSPGSFPSLQAVGKEDEVEEERRVLYVALTRAMDELILTRRRYAVSVSADSPQFWMVPGNPEYMGYPEYAAIHDEVNVKRVTKGRVDRVLSGMPRTKETAEVVESLEKRMAIAEAELNETQQKLAVLEQCLTPMVDKVIPAPSSSSVPTAYFLNSLPVENVDLEAPIKVDSRKIDGSTLAARTRPDVGIDLS